jgi:SKIP/SNW domain
MVDRAEGPTEPAKFKHRKLPRGPSSAPPPIMHSPPRKGTAKERNGLFRPAIELEDSKGLYHSSRPTDGSKGTASSRCQD